MPHPYRHHRRSEGGNTFAYAALALIIAGLALGVVMVWQSMAKSNEIRQSIAAIEQYQSAVQKFKKQFEKLPGDIPYATRIWGAAAGTQSDGYDARCAALTKPSTGKETCNGNGDGWPFDNLATNPGQHYERFRFWQHLANAGFIRGQYTGVGGPHNRRTHHIPGTNSPETPFHDGVFVVTSVSRAQGEVGLWPHPAHVRLEMRSDYHKRLALLTPKQQHDIDRKLDDGKPGTGKIQSYAPMRQPDCTTSSDAATAAYNLGQEAVACSLIYFLER